MKNIDDSLLYLVGGIATLIIAVSVLSASLYSRYVVEERVMSLLSTESVENLSENYRQAYIILREPQLFAKYEHFDRESRGIKRILEFFDRKIVEGEEITSYDARYLIPLFDRRARGSDLGIKSSIFVFIVSFLSFTAFFVEKTRNRRNSLIE